MKNPKIYEMQLHDETYLGDDLFVTRVPGGWVYTQVVTEGSGDQNVRFAVFVPFSKEFIDRE